MNTGLLVIRILTLQDQAHQSHVKNHELSERYKRAERLSEFYVAWGKQGIISHGVKSV